MQAENVKKIETAEDFESLMSLPVVLIDFYADWCPPCKNLKPKLIELAAEYKGNFILAVVNCDNEAMGQFAQQYQVSGIPHCVLLKEGKEVDKFVGGRSKDAVVDFLKNNGISA